MLHLSSPARLAMVKLDIKNAFNLVREDRMLKDIQDLAPQLYQLVYCACSAPSSGEIRSFSPWQEYSTAPLLRLSIYQIQSWLQSKPWLLNLDGITISGSLERIQHNIQVTKEESQDLGLILNHQKSEIVCNDPTACASLTSAILDTHVVAPTAAVLLESSVGGIYSVSKRISEKTQLLIAMCSCLQYLSAHDPLLFLRQSFAIPKMLDIFRTSSCFAFPVLQSYDIEHRSILSVITTTSI